VESIKGQIDLSCKHNAGKVSLIWQEGSEQSAQQSNLSCYVGTCRSSATMVYGGKPSNGCLTCKSRRVKVTLFYTSVTLKARQGADYLPRPLQCDESKPICRRCVKARRECLGYQPRIDLILHDETHKTEKRVRSLHNLITRNDSTPICSAPSQDPELIASNFFWANLGRLSRQPKMAVGLMELLPAMQARTSSESVLSTATVAMSLIAFGQIHGSTRFLRLARSKYSEALTRLKTALGDDVQVRKDETLMAVLILGISEVRMGRLTPSPISCMYVSDVY